MFGITVKKKKATLVYAAMMICIVLVARHVFEGPYKIIKVKCVAYEYAADIRQRRSTVVCPERLKIQDKSFNVSHDHLSFPELNKRHGHDLDIGGHFHPRTCNATQRVSIIVPYRKREDNLKMLLNNLHPFLKAQNVDYTIFVAEQLPGTKFNRGMIKNIGFVEAQKISFSDCVFFHDVDMTPDNLDNLYQCGDNPRQHSRKLPRWNNTVPVGDTITNFGGVVSMKSIQFLKVNGYSNSFFEWGCEDDELKLRLDAFDFPTSTYPFHVSSYQEFSHKRQANDVLKSHDWYLQWTSRLEDDGLTNLHYSMEKIVFNPLYTHFYVNINMTAMKISYKGKLAGLD